MNFLTFKSKATTVHPTIINKTFRRDKDCVKYYYYIIIIVVYNL